jgi:hypothetical protein
MIVIVSNGELVCSQFIVNNKQLFTFQAVTTTVTAFVESRASQLAVIEFELLGILHLSQ